MNPNQAKTWESVEQWLKSKGFVPTSEYTDDGGRFWRSKSRKHIIVPQHIDGFFPEYFFTDLERRVNDIVP